MTENDGGCPPLHVLRALIAVSGASALALELLASRVMTPYFGASVHIWAGVLSITLVALAAGYALGGRLARRREPLGVLLRLPAVAALALAAAVIVYPSLFYRLAQASLVLGAFAACLVLLGIPLLATAAMNPLLVAVERQAGIGRGGDGAGGDGGAGRIFFLSTAGSVGGVLATAFLLVPHVGNRESLVGVAALLALSGLVAAWSARRAGALRRSWATRLGVAALLACALAWSAPGLRLDAGGGSGGEGVRWAVDGTYRSAFGTVKIVRIERGGGEPRTIYLQDGVMQDVVGADGRPQALFTYAVDALARAARPDMRTALVLGLGAGVMPMRLAARGVEVEIVDVNPDAWTAAELHFGFDPDLFRRRRVADARVAVRECAPGGFDAILVDVFQGDGTPEHLLTREFFADLARCLAPGGAVAFNTILTEAPRRHVLATLRTAFPHVGLFAPPPAGPSGYRHEQAYVLASNAPIPAGLAIRIPDLPEMLRGEFERTFGAGIRLIGDEDVRGVAVVSDAANFLPAALTEAALSYRRMVLDLFPYELLVN